MLPHTITISNKLEELEQLPAFLECCCEGLLIPPSQVMSLNLALEEAMVNCVNYAYGPGNDGKITLTAELFQPPKMLTFTLSDAGQPFDPTTVPATDTTLTLEERPIGGLGILLVRNIMDSVQYQYDGHHNILTMSKNLPETI
jgi:anti-sigma regulatory factor (Ser/Thr protein kinase)